MGEVLTFTVKYSRKVQPQAYEHINIGWEEEFPKDTVTRLEAYKIVRDFVEARIDSRLQELYVRERR